MGEIYNFLFTLVNDTIHTFNKYGKSIVMKQDGKSSKRVEKIH